MERDGSGSDREPFVESARVLEWCAAARARASWHGAQCARLRLHTPARYALALVSLCPRSLARANTFALQSIPVAIAICEQRAAMASSATCEHEHEHALCAVRARITLPLLVFRFIFAPAPRVYTRSAVHSILVGVRTMSAGCSLFMFSI